MFKYLIVILVNVCYIQSEKIDFEKFANGLYPFGDPSLKMADEVKTLEKYCNGELKKIVNEKFVEEAKQYIQEILKGKKEEVDQLAKIVLSAFDIFPNTPFCQSINKTNLASIAKELDNLTVKFKVVRDKFVTVLTDAAKPDTTIKAKDFTCFVKLFVEEFDKIAAEKPIAKDFIQELTKAVTKCFIVLMETAKGKANKKCELPPAAAQPSKYKSIHIPLALAIANLLDK